LGIASDDDLIEIGFRKRERRNRLTMTCSHTSKLSYATIRTLIVGAVILTAGCATPPALDDARLDVVEVATSDDLLRFSHAKQALDRQLFGGATFRDLQNRIVTFTEDNYDGYQAYIGQHPEIIPIAKDRADLDLPTLRISFFTSRMLIEPEVSETVYQAFGSLYLCDDGNPLGDSLASADVMWRGRFVTGQIAENIKTALGAGAQPQEYEIIVRYTNYKERRSWRPGAEAVTLLPPPGDLCFALVKMNYPLPSTAGRPLRINKEAVKAVLGTLPREIPLRPHQP
jgi:hypothetical protein